MSEQNAQVLSALVDQLAAVMPQFFRAPVPQPRPPGAHAELDLATDRPGVARPSADAERTERMFEVEKRRASLWATYQTIKTPPAVASSARRDEMGRLGREIEQAHGIWTDKQVDVMDEAVTALQREQAAALEEFKERKKQLTASLGGTMQPGQDVAPSATKKEAGALEQRRAGLQAKIDADDATMDGLTPLDADIAGFADEIEAVRAKVAERLKRKEEIEQEAAEVELHPDAPRNALDTEKEAVKAHLATAPLTDEALKSADGALGKLKQAAEAASARAAVQRLKHDEYSNQLAAARSQVEKAKSTPNDAGTKLPSLDSAVKECADLLPAPPFDERTDARLQAFPGALTKLQQQAGTYVTQCAKGTNRGVLKPYFNKELEEVTAQWQRLTQLPGLPVVEEPLQLKTARATVAKDLPRAGPLGETGTAMQKALDGARVEIARLREGAIQKAAEWQGRKDKVLARVGVADPANVADDFAAELEKRRKAVQSQFQAALSDRLLVDAEQESGRFVEMWKRAERDAVDGAVVGAIRKRLDASLPETLKEARSPVRAELSAAWEAAKKVADTPAPARVMSRSRTLFETLERRVLAAQDEGPKKEAVTGGLASRQVGNEAVTGETAKEIYDLLGPDALATLGAGADSVQVVCEAFHGASADEVKALRALFLEGLAGHARALAAVVRTGDGAALRALAVSFGGNGEAAVQDRKHLGAMVGAGGMGDHPEVLGDLLKFGVRPGATDANQKRQSNVGKLKELGDTFGSQAGSQRLKTLLSDCGLGTQPTGNRPGAFAEIVLNDGCQADDLSRFARDIGQSEKANLKGVMESGGLGARPAGLAPLVKGSGLQALKDIGNAFKQPGDRVRLKAIMDNGGLSGEAPRPGDPANAARKHEHADTLAKVYKDGLGGSADNLVTFAAAFGPVPAQSKMMLDAWNEYPDQHQQRRQPGKQMAQVMSRLGGTDDEKIGKLQSQFTHNINRIGSAAKRPAACRFAPDLATENAPTNLGVPGNMPANYICMANNAEGNSLCRRHVAKYLSRARLDNQNTLWPIGTDATKLTQYLGAAIADVLGNGAGMPAGRNDPRVADVGGGKMAALGAEPNQFNLGEMVVNHFHPAAGWPQADPNEVQTFSRQDATLMLDAVGA